MKRLNITIGLFAAIAVIALGSSASAQYFEPGRESDGYLPEARSEPVAYASSPQDEVPGPPDLRFGIGLDFGGSSFALRSLDEELHEPNRAAELGRYPNFAFDANGFVELVQTVRFGFLTGARAGGAEDVGAVTSFFDFTADIGHISRYGWGFLAGGSVGVGFFGSESENRFDEYYEYAAVGLHLRAHVRGELQLTPYFALRLTGFYEALNVRDDEVTIDVPADAPEPVLGEPDGNGNGFGVTFGVVFTTF